MEFKNPLIFLAGAAVGAVVSWLITKDHYESIADQEIESVKQAFHAKTHEYENAREKATAAKEKPDFNQYRKILEDSKAKNRVDYSKGAPDDIPEVEETEDPRIITRAELLENNGYFKPVITYYSDGIFADEENNEIDDISKYLGAKYGKIYFGNCEADETYFRNDELASDITVVKDLKTYEESLQEG